MNENDLPAFTDGFGDLGSGATGLLNDFPSAGSPAKLLEYLLLPAFPHASNHRNLEKLQCLHGHRTDETIDFIDFARSEGRFGKHFDRDGNPSKTLLRAKEDRLENWHLLQELAGMI